MLIIAAWSGYAQKASCMAVPQPKVNELIDALDGRTEATRSTTVPKETAS